MAGQSRLRDWDKLYRCLSMSGTRTESPQEGFGYSSRHFSHRNRYLCSDIKARATESARR